MGSYVFQTSGRLSVTMGLLQTHFFPTLLRPMIGSDKRHFRGIKRSEKIVNSWKIPLGNWRLTAPVSQQMSMCLYVVMFRSFVG